MTKEGTEDAILVKLPIDTDEKDLKGVLNNSDFENLQIIQKQHKRMLMNWLNLSTNL